MYLANPTQQPVTGDDGGRGISTMAMAVQEMDRDVRLAMERLRAEGQQQQQQRRQQQQQQQQRQQQQHVPPFSTTTLNSKPPLSSQQQQSSSSNQQLISVVVPPGTPRGGRMNVTYNGKQYEFIVPDGAGPMSTLQIQIAIPLCKECLEIHY